MKNNSDTINDKEIKDNSESLEAKFGLPSKVEFCKSCVISNQRPSSVAELTNKSSNKKPTINLDENGICDACNFAKYKRKETRKKYCNKS